MALGGGGQDAIGDGEQGTKVHTCEGEGVDVLAVIAACHELLAKTDSVLALGDVVEDFELLFRNALCGLSETWGARNDA